MLIVDHLSTVYSCASKHSRLPGKGFSDVRSASRRDDLSVGLFVDGGFGFAISKTEDRDAVNGFEIGFKPGIAIKLNQHFSLVAKCGFLGYQDDYSESGSAVGFKLGSENLSFGFHYEF